MNERDLIDAIKRAKENPLVAGRESFGIRILTYTLADILERDNPTFNRVAFLHACD